MEIRWRSLANLAGGHVENSNALVMNSGVDDASLYPHEHTTLARRIVEADGAVLSEYPPGVGPEKYHFPERNRIIAALADVVVVVESHDTGGALLTVDEALERSRTVMAVPGPVGSPASRGTNQLLADGG